METVALFGGSFDPPHIGHVTIVEALQRLEYIDKILLVPAFLNPFKEKSFSSPQVRLQWLKSLFNNKEKVIIEEFELKQKRKVATIETVTYLLRKYKKIYLVIGADNLQRLSEWQDYEELEQKVTFIIATRDNIAIPKEFIKLNINENISSTQIRKETHAK
jgi:nicotinate-nucleotide adenylyltransferase